MFTGLKKVEIVKVGRVWVEGKDQDFNGKKVKIQMNETFTKEIAKESIGKIVELNCKIDITESYKGYKEVTLYPYNLEAETQKNNERLQTKERETAINAINKMLHWVEEKAKEGKRYENGFAVIEKNKQFLNNEDLIKLDEKLQKIEKEIKENKEKITYSNQRAENGNKGWFHSSSKYDSPLPGSTQKFNGSYVKILTAKKPYWDADAGDFDAHYDLNDGAWCFEFTYETLETEERIELEVRDKKVKEEKEKIAEEKRIEKEAKKKIEDKIWEKIGETVKDLIIIKTSADREGFFKVTKDAERISFKDNSLYLTKDKKVYRYISTNYILADDQYGLTNLTEEDFEQIKKIK